MVTSLVLSLVAPLLRPLLTVYVQSCYSLVTTWVQYGLQALTHSQSVLQDQGSDASGGSGKSRGSGSSAGKKRKRESGSKGRAGAEAVIEVEGDEPAQLITMQPVSHLLPLLYSRTLMPDS